MRYKTPLLQATYDGKVEEVKKILEADNIESNIIENGNTALHVAAERGHIEIIKYLVEEKADVNAASQTDDNTPLHMAAKNNQLAAVTTLLALGASIYQPNCFGETPLSVALQENTINHHLIIALIHADKNKKTINQFSTWTDSTPLQIAAAKPGLEQIIEKLIEHGAEVNAKDQKEEKTALHFAAQAGYLENCEKLLQPGEENIDLQDKQRRTPLHLAAQKGHIKVMEFLIVHGADVNKEDTNGQTPLDLVLNAELDEKKCLDTMAYLIQKGANINRKDKDGKTLLHLAAQKNNKFKIILLKKIPELQIDEKDANGQTPLHAAVTNNSVGAVYHLINSHFKNQKGKAEYYPKEADVNAVDNKGQTPLHLAAQNGYTEILKSLLEKKAHVNVLDNAQKTPLCLALENKILNEDLVIALIDADEKNETIERFSKTCSTIEYTPLQMAALHGSKKIVQKLIDKHVAVNAQVKTTGETALQLAAQYGHTHIIEILIKNGANINATNNAGQTPLQLAEENGHTLAKQTLIQLGALSAPQNPTSTPVNVQGVSPPDKTPKPRKTVAKRAIQLLCITAVVSSLCVHATYANVLLTVTPMLLVATVGMLALLIIQIAMTESSNNQLRSLFMTGGEKQDQGPPLSSSPRRPT